MLLRVDYKSGQPVYAQLLAQIKTAAASGALHPGESLPAIGPLAEELRVGRNSVAKAYAELENLGIIELLPDTGYRLKEPHRPLRKEVARAADAGASSQRRARRAIRTTVTYALLSLLAAALYFGLVGLFGALLVRAGLLRGEVVALGTALFLAAVFLPLRNRLQRAVERRVFRKRHNVPRALETLKAESWSPPSLDAFLEKVIETSESIVGVRPILIRDHGEVLALVNAFPALRSAREPVAAGNHFLMPLFSQDEVLGVLHLEAKPAGGTYDAEDWEFLRAAAEQVTSAANQFRLRNERRESEYAFDIQRALLPRETPQPPGFSIAGAWQPARTVGGDYYDVFWLNETQLALIVADVAGKGAPAALLMANVQAATRAYATMTPSPRELCSRVNRAICASSAERFVTFFYAVLDPAERRLTYTNAGHNPPLVVSRDGACRKLATGGPVLGLLAQAEFEQDALELRAGDRLLIFTDGLVEAEGGDGEEFGDERLFTAMTASADVTAPALRDSIMQAVTHFCGADFADDATLLTVVVKGGPSGQT
ncbi:MAG TPA: SpoIIE family protein phosphatase [Terriglobales bacterium]|nr:SpoIIE family protein phosphatase [Terriglobales bacterium]